MNTRHTSILSPSVRRGAAGVLVIGALAGIWHLSVPAQVPDQPQGGTERTWPQARAKNVLGTWIFSPFNTFITITPGALVASSFSAPRSAALPNGMFWHTGHGSWIKNDKAQIVMTHIGRVHDLDGKELYWYTGLSTWELDATGDHLKQVGEGSFKWVDPSGKVINSGSDGGGGTAVRFWGGPSFQMP